MVKAIWMSDPHFTHEGNVLDHDPRVRLQAAVDHINRHHSDADFCVISGDMVNRGMRADYAALQVHLETLSVPLLPMVGNHDDRKLLREVFVLPDTCMDDFVQYTVAMGAGLAVCLDTQKTGFGGGEYCDARHAWLKEALENAADTPVYLFMHHPPMDVGLPMQDQDKMEDGDIFIDLISNYDCVKYMFIGHVHRPISGVIKGIPFSTMRSILYQAPPPLPAWDWDTFHPAKEAPNLGVVTIEGPQVTLQFEQFCRFETGVFGKSST